MLRRQDRPPNLLLPMNRNSITRLAVILAGMALFAGKAQAIIVAGAVTAGPGAFILLTPPLPNPFGPANSVGNDTFQSPNLYGFNEDQNVAVSGSALAVDYKPG